MLILIIDEYEVYNEEDEEFISFEPVSLQLEHSLVSLSKWESKFGKPFLSKDEKTINELMEYIEVMIISPEYPSDIFERLTQRHFEEVNNYIESAQSATTFGSMPEVKTHGKAETITSELIYYWLVAFNIPFEVEKWHLNRLFALIKICNLKNSKPQKMSKSAIAKRNRDLNEQRRKQLGTTG